MLKRLHHKHLTQLKRFQSTLPTLKHDDEYTATPQYPPILDLSFDAKRERKKEAECEAIKQVKTVEEKQIKLNMPRYYGFKCSEFIEDTIPYNNLPISKYATRTHLIDGKNLPDFYAGLEIDDVLVGELQAQVEEALVFEHEGVKRSLSEEDIVANENQLASNIVRHIHRLIVNNLARRTQYSHLLDTQFDVDPRHEAWWVVGGLPPPEIIRNAKAGNWMKDRQNEPVDRYFRYLGQPILTLRHEQPLAPIISYNEAEYPSFKVPQYEYQPNSAGMFTQHAHAANVPGFWAGDIHAFGMLSYLKRGHLLTRSYDDPNDLQHALLRQGIIGSFAWLSAQANYLGFTTYNDVTYPLVTQTVITNGKQWSLFVYQLNTMQMYGRHAFDNPKSNVCWSVNEQKLYDDVTNSRVINFNPDVLKMLLKLYINQPQERLGVKMRPYLSQEEKLSADYADDDKRQWLEREYKYLVSNRPRYKTQYEIYLWEKIYKIDHKTRPLEPRRRPFELFVNPFKRTLDDRQAFYIPRAHRPDLPRHKGRYKKEYFP